ncbi:MAG: carbohydrate binding domain-containing protein [Bacteroidales bacterium]|nr:carbohydrate binding domain-containing protein [Bacteroidales bacterium]
MFKYKRTLLIFAGLLTAATLMAQTVRMDVNLKKPGAPIQPTMYGVFFEDINFAADGGLYGDMVKNRSFDFPYALTGWMPYGKLQVMDDGPFERNPHYLRLNWSGHRDKFTGVENEGFFGMGLKAGEKYDFSVWARSAGGRLRIELVDNDSMTETQILAQGTINVSSSQWTKYKLTLESPVTIEDAHLRVELAGNVPVDIEHVSLFPQDTWKGREGGLRKDLAQALYDLHPGVFRFPGGCIVEGTDLETRYNWKNSVGPVENRPVNENRWHYTFGYKLFPDYYTSYGFGFYEFFQLCEDFGCEPLPVVSCGLACQFQNDDPSAHVPVDELGPYIQDALDLIEFANGGVNTTWGRVRAEMGHPEPFNLKMLAVGNEQWGEEYPAHLKPFVDALRKAYPQIKIIGTSGPNSEGDQFDYLWPEMKKLGVDLVDEHFYRPEKWFLSQGTRYDSYDRKGPKVFAGEYACHGDGKKWNHFNASLLEAAFMTGLERNADVVHMATYAPLFAHVEGWQWRPDLIWYDNLRSVRSCSWYVQQLYSQYRGQNVLSLTWDGKPVAGTDGQQGLFASAVQDGNLIYVKVANTSSSPNAIEFSFDGLKKTETVKAVKSIVYTSPDPDADNTLDDPEAITPRTRMFFGEGTAVKATVDPMSFNIFVFER